MRPAYLLPLTRARPAWRIPCGVLLSSATRGLCSPTNGFSLSIVTTSSPPTGRHLRSRIMRAIGFSGPVGSGSFATIGK